MPDNNEDRDQQLLKKISKSYDAADKVISALAKRPTGGSMLTLADKWKTEAEAIAKNQADAEFKKGAKDSKGEPVRNWETSRGTRKNKLFKNAELEIAQADGYEAWQVKDNPFTYEGDFKIFMNLITRHSLDKPVPYADFIQQIRSDCAESLKKVAKIKRFYKTGTFSPMYLDYEAFIIAYAHQIVKTVKKAYSVKDPATNKFIYPDNPSVETLNFPKPIKPPKPKAVKPYEGIDGFNKSKDQLKMEFEAYLQMKPHEIKNP
jgi:hypothetical protein